MEKTVNIRSILFVLFFERVNDLKYTFVYSR